MKVVFTKQDHKYKDAKNTYTSVTRVIEQYKNPFDKDFWSTYKAIERIVGTTKFKKIKKGWDINSEEFLFHALSNVSDQQEVADVRDEILKEWNHENKKSIRKGNRYHDAREKKSIKQGFEVNPFDGKSYKVPANVIGTTKTKGNNKSLKEDLFNLEDGYYPELLLWNKDHMIAGQADKVFIETLDGYRFIDVDDYKTNKKIKRESYYSRGKGYSMMKAPLDHLMDCNYTHYCLQISIYAWMLEQFGFNVRNLSFHHFNKEYTVPYMKDSINKIFDLPESKFEGL